MEARFYKAEKGRVQCLLCPHQCYVKDGATGKCKVRRNEKGVLLADTWGKPSAVHFDPIEKKPLYHFYPGKEILSIGSNGCNMSCLCCQNWQISQTDIRNSDYTQTIQPADIVKLADGRKENIGIAYTYNEPTVWFEYMMDIAVLAKYEGYKNVMVTNGFINPDPLKELLNYIDALNIDLKGFTNDFYKRFTGGQLHNVLQTLKAAKKAGKHIEVTFLVIPTMNDNEKIFTEMNRWIVNELGNETVLHLSRYHPAYQFDLPSTSPESIIRLKSIAGEYLSYVYVGNMPGNDYQDTYCSNCGQLLIRRRGYHTELVSLSEKGKCNSCDHHVVTFGVS